MNGKLSIGWATADISPKDTVCIPGQFSLRISEGVAEPISCTALALYDGNDLVVFLSVDSVGIPRETVEEIRTNVREKNPSINTDKIIVNVTHSHTTPDMAKTTEVFHLNISDYEHNGIEAYDRAVYLKFFVSKATECICSAFENMAPGKLAYGYGYGVTGHCRRPVYYDNNPLRCGDMGGIAVNGTGCMYGPTNDENFSHYESGQDVFLNFVYTFDDDENLTGAIVNVPCPSQCSEMEHTISSDYWHEVRLGIKEKYGNIFILPQCAPAGDVSPRPLHNKAAQERRLRLKYGNTEVSRAQRRDVAEQILTAFSEVLSWAKKEIITEAQIIHRMERVPLERRFITSEEYEFAREGLEKCNRRFAEEVKGSTQERLFAETGLVNEKMRFENVIRNYSEQVSNSEILCEIHVLKVGDFAFATSGFELFIDFMHRIQARSPFKQTMLVQLACGIDTYLATERAAEAKGYSACLFCNAVSANGGKMLVERILEILREIF